MNGCCAPAGKNSGAFVFAQTCCSTFAAMAKGKQQT
jgi:hypothetical protein